MIQRHVLFSGYLLFLSVRFCNTTGLGGGGPPGQHADHLFLYRKTLMLGLELVKAGHSVACYYDQNPHIHVLSPVVCLYVAIILGCA